MIAGIMRARAKLEQHDKEGVHRELSALESLVSGYLVRDERSETFGHYYKLDEAYRAAEELSAKDEYHGTRFYVYALSPVFSFRTRRRVDTEKQVY